MSAIEHRPHGGMDALRKPSMSQMGHSRRMAMSALLSAIHNIGHRHVRSKNRLPVAFGKIAY